MCATCIECSQLEWHLEFMKRRWAGLSRIALLAVSSLAPACDSPAGSGSSTTIGPVCPDCEKAGGETSDFGNIAPPTPCEASTALAPIDDATARALGFGSVPDLVVRPIDASYAWSLPLYSAPAPGSPPSGYETT